MKLQASILIGVILISGAIMKQMPWFVVHGETGVEAHVAKLPVANKIILGQSTNNGVVSSDNATSNKQIDSASLDSQNNEESKNIDEKEALSAKEPDIIEKTPVEKKIIADPICNMPNASIFLTKSFNDGEIFFEKNSSNMWPIASISKLLAMAVVMEDYDFKKTVEITNDIYNKVAPYNTFKVGDRYSTNDLVRASIVASSNDATYALASVIGEDEFVKKMREKAKEIGMEDTNIKEPSGLSYKNQSTANDLYKLIKYIYNTYPALLATSRNKSISVYDLNSRKRRTLYSTDHLVNMKDFYGGKTGFIDESGQNLIALFQKNGKIIMTLVMGSDDRFSEVENMYDCVK